MFPHPLGVVACENGLSVSYPGAAIVASADAIMGGGVSSNGDVVIGLAGDAKFKDARLKDFSDWFITTEFAASTGNLKTSFGHGSPYVFCELDGGDLQLSFAEKPVLWSGDNASNAVGISVRGNHYGLFGPSDSKWEVMNEKAVQLVSKNRYFTLALLPDNQAETFEKFKELAHNHVVDTGFEFEFSNGQLLTNWKFTTKAMQPASSKDTLTTLYPHQWKYSDAELIEKSYRSVRGEMKLFKGRAFATSVPTQGVLPMLPAEGIADRNRMIGYLNAEAKKEDPPFGDTYWEGKHLGRLSSLSGIAECLGKRNLQEAFVNQIRSRLENWFTVSQGEHSPLFYYDDTWGTLIGSRPSYGSDVELNDHHFHYGYFIRAAADVARFDRNWAKEWGPMVELLINEIAAVQKDNSLFPRMRCFDLYAGHSWASGHARFGDGNNQESSSESMNAWYGMMLWGEATGNTQIRERGAFLFNTERTAIEEYWFDISGTNYPDDFPNVALGMVWGGKGAFATWFSGEIDHIHGINWLPMTPASVYMGRKPDYVKSNHETVVSKRKFGRDFNKGWGDLVVMFGALSDPAPAVEFIDSNPNCELEGGNSHAFMCHWIHTLDRLGLNDASVTADYPFANVFLKDGKKTYAVYNFNRSPITVRFSDGHVVNASQGMTVE